MDTFLADTEQKITPPEPSVPQGKTLQELALDAGFAFNETGMRLGKAMNKLLERYSDRPKAVVSVIVWPALSSSGMWASWLTARIEFPGEKEPLEVRELAVDIDDLERAAKETLNQLVRKLTKEGKTPNGTNNGTTGA